jgi:hypothetical protein
LLSLLEWLPLLKHSALNRAMGVVVETHSLSQSLSHVRNVGTVGIFSRHCSRMFYWCSIGAVAVGVGVVDVVLVVAAWVGAIWYIGFGEYRRCAIGSVGVRFVQLALHLEFIGVGGTVQAALKHYPSKR